MLTLCSIEVCVLFLQRKGGEGREREVGNFSFVWPRRAIIELVVMAKVF